MKANIQFLGAAGTVTGSKTLVEYEGKRTLIDCGLFEGIKELRLQNWSAFPVRAKSIENLILTHAHLDHCGYIPLLVKKGFRGDIYCTKPTQKLAAIILRDSAKIQQEEAERANRHGYSKHHPAQPLYNLDDVNRSLPLFTSNDYHNWIEIDEFLKFQFLNAGHILGSALVQLKLLDKTILFTGDLGRQHPLLLDPPEIVEHADIVVLESTYGDRLHEEENLKEELYNSIWHTYNRGGILMIPTFAVERAQELIYILAQLKEEKSLPPVPIYLDSPMGVSATEVMMEMHRWHSLSNEEITGMDQTVQLITDVASSRKIVEDRGPKIILAGSGMITGGRILHYLDHYLAEDRNTILLVGYQAAGTRGRSLEEGAAEIKFFGQYHQVKAEVKKITCLSAHADQREILTWLNGFKSPPAQVFINHGEAHASDALRVKIQHELGWNVEVAKAKKLYAI